MKQLNWYQIFGKSNIPDGRTVLPTDDIQIWLHCANIWNKSYTTLAEVLADTDTLLALITSNNAVDYMVRSTTWAESVALVPAMTSDTTPSGVCSASSVYQTFSAYKAFDGNTESSNYWSANTGVNSWLQYRFVSAIMPYLVKVRGVYADGHLRIKNFTVQGSNDGVTFTDIKSFQTIDKSGEQTFEVGSINNYSYLRISIADNWSETYYIRLHEVQFYSASIVTSETAMQYIGQNNYCANTLLADATWCNAICNSEYFESVLNVKVPVMTSNTTPSGECLAGQGMSASEPAWKAFDGNTNTRASASSGALQVSVAYKFESAVKPYLAYVYSAYSGYYQYKIRYSDDNVTWSDATDFSTPTWDSPYILLSIANEHQYWGIVRKYTSADSGIVREVNFYGRKDV